MNQEQSPIANREVSGDRERQRKNARDNLIHAGEFTKIENTAIVYVLRGWFGALIRPENATEIVQASDDVWAAQTVFEHFDSAELKARAEAAQEHLNQLLGGDTDEDERINQLTDKEVEEVLKKLGL